MILVVLMSELDKIDFGKLKAFMSEDIDIEKIKTFLNAEISSPAEIKEAVSKLNNAEQTFLLHVFESGFDLKKVKKD